MSNKPIELEPDHNDFLGALDDIMDVIREIRGRTEATKHPGFEFMAFEQNELRDLAHSLQQAYDRLKHPRFILRQEGRDEEIAKLREQVREFDDRLKQQSQRIDLLANTEPAPWTGKKPTGIEPALIDRAVGTDD